MNSDLVSVGREIHDLTRDLCTFATGVVAPANESFFDRVSKELPLSLRRFSSGTTHNGWVVPQEWRVESARLYRGDDLLFDGSVHPLGVAAYSKSFQGELDWPELEPHLVTNSDLPEAYVYHCMWQYRPWDADWALSIPHSIYRQLGPGRYRVHLKTEFLSGAMLVGEYEHRGVSDRTIIFNAHTCHPVMANDDFAGVAVLVRLFQWLRDQETYYTYRLVLGPEHLGTVFYLNSLDDDEVERFVSGAFSEMPGTAGPVKVASTFLGDQVIDRAFRNVLRHHTVEHKLVPWRMGAGNDETVWESPGYEVPFVEVSRCEDLLYPFGEYHTSLDNADLMDPQQLGEFFDVFRRTVEILERNARVYRHFKGIICLSNPEYGLYMERPDPAVQKELSDDSEKWGYLLDNLLRYFDGSKTILDISERHDLPFESVHRYLRRFEEKGLVELEFAPIERAPVSESRASLEVR